MFTIEVKKRGKDEEFGFGDLEMFHQECYGGRIKQVEDEAGSLWTLICQRCGQTTVIDKRERSTLIIKTAVDGQRRQITEYEAPYYKYLEVSVIQKT